ncbi:MAG: hypothetical protein ACK5MY_04120 [Jhaorihella sp.]
MKFLRSPASAALGAVLAVSAGAANAAPFDIQVNFLGGLSATQQAIFTIAETFWESHITGYQEDPGLTSMQIDAQGVAIDGAGGILGSAGPTTGVSTSSFLYTSTGSMSFDTADLLALEIAGTLLDVIKHEMAHVMGFGTLWSSSAVGVPGKQEVYVDGTGQYTGAWALAAYQAECDAGATSVPVEIGGFGPGTDDGHWDEVGFCGHGSEFTNPELMTGFLTPDATVSTTTIASFADLGYTTTATHMPPMSPVPVPPGMVLAASGFVFLGFLRRRKSRA